MLLLNRFNISKKHLKKFSDEKGVFVYYSNEQITKYLKCNHGTATTVLKNLESAGLIRKGYQKCGLPLKIYVNDVFGIYNRTYQQGERVSGRGNDCCKDHNDTQGMTPI